MREITSGFAAVVIYTRLLEMGFGIYQSLAAAVLFGYITAYAAADMFEKKKGERKHDGKHYKKAVRGIPKQGRI